MVPKPKDLAGDDTYQTLYERKERMCQMVERGKGFTPVITVSSNNNIQIALEAGHKDGPSVEIFLNPLFAVRVSYFDLLDMADALISAHARMKHYMCGPFDSATNTEDVPF